jgi:hypothetical protein
MRKTIWALGVLALTAGLAAAQDKAALEKTLIANEHKINEAVAKGDKAAFSSLTAPEGWSADSNGFMKVGDFVPMMDQMKLKTWKMSDEKVQWVDASTAIVLYNWAGTGTFQGQAIPSRVYCSTVWTKKAGKWTAVYHQESEAAKPAAVKK